MYKIKGMSGIKFEDDLLTLKNIYIQYVHQNALELLSTNMALFFTCDEPLPVKSPVKSAFVGRRGNESLVTENLVRPEVLSF